MTQFDQGFNAGTVAALAILRAHDDPVAWREIVEAAGAHQVLVHALSNEGDWQWAGFEAYAVAELGQSTVDKARAAAALTTPTLPLMAAIKGDASE